MHCICISGPYNTKKTGSKEPVSLLILPCGKELLLVVVSARTTVATTTWTTVTATTTL